MGNKFHIKYKISPASLFRLQREIWGKEILPSYNYSKDVGEVGRKQGKVRTLGAEKGRDDTREGELSGSGAREADGGGWS